VEDLFYWWRKPTYWVKTTNMPQEMYKYYHTGHGCNKINNLIANGTDCNQDSLSDNTA
jgi:hypothetical protein